VRLAIKTMAAGFRFLRSDLVSFPIDGAPLPRDSRTGMNEKKSRKGTVTVSKVVRKILRKGSTPSTSIDHVIWQSDSEEFLKALPEEPMFDLVVTSPPYNIGKSYEKRGALDSYLAWQKRIIALIIPRLKSNGSICWQVGNFVDNGQIVPLDIEFAPIFKSHGLQMRNRIIWRFGHGLHTRRRFSGRYEVVLWYTKSEEYFFDLDAVRVRAKYPGKRHFKGPRKGEISGNPLGKNPEDVWEGVEDVKNNHVEKTWHPCQFPVGLIERLVLSMTKPGGLVFDPFAGVGSAGVAAAIHGRRFWGCELDAAYAKEGQRRVSQALEGSARYRPHDKPLYDHTKSSLSKMPGPEGG
jgi:adenine-specific DNA-methyltransferase